MARMNWDEQSRRSRLKKAPVDELVKAERLRPLSTHATKVWAENEVWDVWKELQRLGDECEYGSRNATLYYSLAADLYEIWRQKGKIDQRTYVRMFNDLDRRFTARTVPRAAKDLWLKRVRYVLNHLM